MSIQKKNWCEVERLMQQTALEEEEHVKQCMCFHTKQNGQCKFTK
jgi:hypothetical protein